MTVGLLVAVEPCQHIVAVGIAGPRNFLRSETAVRAEKKTCQFLKNVASQGLSSIRVALPFVGVKVPRMRYEYGELGRAWPTA